MLLCGMMDQVPFYFFHLNTFFKQHQFFFFKTNQQKYSRFICFRLEDGFRTFWFNFCHQVIPRLQAGIFIPFLYIQKCLFEYECDFVVILKFFEVHSTPIYVMFLIAFSRGTFRQFQRYVPDNQKITPMSQPPPQHTHSSPELSSTPLALG